MTDLHHALDLRTGWTSLNDMMTIQGDSSDDDDDDDNGDDDEEGGEGSDDDE